MTKEGRNLIYEIRCRGFIDLNMLFLTLLTPCNPHRYLYCQTKSGGCHELTLLSLPWKGDYSASGTSEVDHRRSISRQQGILAAFWYSLDGILDLDML